MEELIATLDPTTWGGLLALYLLSGLLSVLFARRSQVDAWAESHPRLAAVLKLLRSLGLDPWMVLQSISLLVRGRLPQSSKSPPQGPSHIGPAVLLLVAVALLGGSYACSAPDPKENARAENASLVLMRTSVEIGDPVWEEVDRIEQTPVCGAVAIGPREVVSAAHCAREDATTIALVTRRQWFVETDSYVVADVVERHPVLDLMRLRPREGVPHTGLSTLTSGRVLTVTRYETEWRELEFDRVRDARLLNGHSGSGVFDEAGDLVGVMVECPMGSGERCDALVVRP